MNQNDIGQLLVLLIVVIGFIVMVSGKNSGKVLKYLFSPVTWVLGSLVRLAILAAVLFIGYQMLPKSGFEGIDLDLPGLATARNQFVYPVGGKDSNGHRYGQGWRVSQDFADTINPESAAQSGRHLGEDWVPSKGKATYKPVYAIADGRIIRNERNNSFGHVVMILHEVPGLQSSYVTALYGHIDPIQKVGLSVTQGEQIGVIADSESNGCNAGCNYTASGCSPRPGSGKKASECHGWPEHLHFELRGVGAKSSPGFGYSDDHTGFLNPTDIGSDAKNTGGGWIDGWR